MKNSNQIKKMAKATSGLVALSALCFTTHAAAAQGDLIINEWNAVGPNKYLEDDGSDTFFGQVQGNGGDWIELVVIKDDMDMRGVQLDWTNDDTTPKTGTITFASSGAGGAFWQFHPLKAGTIIVIRDGATTNVPSIDPTAFSCDPSVDNGAWDDIIVINSNDTTYITKTGVFNPDNDGWRMRIRDSMGNTVQNYVGEPSSCVICTGSGLSSEEVGKLEEDPAADAAVHTPAQLGNYNDGDSSTYGAPNLWNSGANEQCFDALTGCGC